MLSCHIEIFNRISPHAHARGEDGYFGNILLNIINGREVVKILMHDHTMVND